MTVALPGIDASDAQIAQAVQSARPVFLRTWPGIVASRHDGPAFISVVAMNDMGKWGSRKPRRLPFMFDLVVVPAASLGADLTKLAARQGNGEPAPAPIFGENLERRPEIWPSQAGWKFTSQGLLVSAGDIGLIDGEGYGDYRFEFELTVPKEGQGVTGWVVRAKDEGNCLMFQIQTADSTFNAPEFKTRPNTLRPHRRSGGQWQIAKPVALPKEIRKGEPHRIAVECRQGTVEVFLDDQRIYARPAWTCGVGGRVPCLRPVRSGPVPCDQFEKAIGCGATKRNVCFSKPRTVIWSAPQFPALRITC